MTSQKNRSISTKTKKPQPVFDLLLRPVLFLQSTSRNNCFGRLLLSHRFRYVLRADFSQSITRIFLRRKSFLLSSSSFVALFFENQKSFLIPPNLTTLLLKSIDSINQSFIGSLTYRILLFRFAFILLSVRFTDHESCRQDFHHTSATHFAANRQNGGAFRAIQQDKHHSKQ